MMLILLHDGIQDYREIIMKTINLQRRRLIGVGGLLLSAALFPPMGRFAFAAVKPTESQLTSFISLSEQLTGYGNLNPILAERYLTAMLNLYPDFATHLSALGDGETVMSRIAHNKSNTEWAMRITHAWYTGTVGPNQDDAVEVIAYKDALMYRPTADGLPVPTYCFRGELWFSALPPGITREPTVPATF